MKIDQKTIDEVARVEKESQYNHVFRLYSEETINFIYSLRKQ